MKIGEAARVSGCNLETIRYYERIGLLPGARRSKNGYRSFEPANIELLRFITRGRELRFSLEEIGSLLRLAGDAEMSCGEVDELARRHLEDINRRRRELAAMARELERTITSCAGGRRGSCAILGALRRGGDA